MLKRLYRLGSRVVPMDITKVLTLDFESLDLSLLDLESNDAHRVPHQDDNEGLTLTCMHTDQIGQWVSTAAYELNDATVASIDGKQVVCIGATIGGQLAGYIFFCASPVDAQRNSGGSDFTGIAIEFSSNVRYLYKALVLPQYRGRQIAQRIIEFAVLHFSRQNVTHVVTTTDWTNAAFLHTVGATGFQFQGTAAECVLFGKHLYFMPESIQAGSDSQINMRKP